jgi:hypothetical protein
LQSGDLSSRIADLDSRSEQMRTGSQRIHVSAVATDWCSRRHALHYLHPESIRDSSSPRSADRLLWSIGRAVEHHIRSSLIESFGPENVLGGWTCACGKTSRSGLGDRTAKCSACGQPLLHYRELALMPHAQTSVFVGSPDMVVLVDGHLAPIEIKSIKLDDFKRLTAPQPAHTYQVSMYLPLLRHTVTEHPVGDTAHVIYGAKDYPAPGVLPYKDFAVPTAETDVAFTLMQQADEQLGPILRNESRRLPSRLPACSSSGTTRARNCTACTLCFSLND